MVDLELATHHSTNKVKHFCFFVEFLVVFDFGWGFFGGGGGFKRFNFVHHHCIEFAMEYICKNENYFLDHYALDVVDLLA